MTLSDILIIYLAIGSPLAVYHFLRSGLKYSFRNLSRCALVLLSWPIYTFWLIGRSETPGHSKNTSLPDYAPLDARILQRVDETRSTMDKIVRERLPENLVFDFREVLERYVGLSLAIMSEDIGEPLRFDAPIFSSEENAKLNGICIDRRNRRLFEFHQIRARNDFLALVEDLHELFTPDLVFYRLVLELSTLLMDDEAVETLKIRQELSGQSEVKLPVIDLENEVWPSKTPRQSAASRV